MQCGDVIDAEAGGLVEPHTVGNPINRRCRRQGVFSEAATHLRQDAVAGREPRDAAAD